MKTKWVYIFVYIYIYIIYIATGMYKGLCYTYVGIFM